jgi:hypothetical protein
MPGPFGGSTTHRREGDSRAPRSLALLVVTVAATALVLSASLATTAAAAPRLVVTMQPNVPFPVRVFALSLPGDSLPAKVAVTENGRKVEASVIPVGSRATPYSAVVLLDASLTMVGRPFAAARTAAGVLIANKPARSELALYGFAARPFAVQDFSKNKRALNAVLASLKVRYGTAMWNTVILASHRLRSRNASARAIVILTDGKMDTTQTPVRSAVAAAQSAGARVFVVIAGPGGTLQRERLQHLAAATGGSVLKVDSIPHLRAAFAQVARILSHQFLLSYASPLTKPGRAVRVHIRLDGATAATRYSIPHPPVAPPQKTAFFFTARGGGLLVGAGVLLPTILLAALAFRAWRADRYLDQAPH